MFQVLNTKCEFLSIQSIYALKNDFRSIQVTLEAPLAIYLSMKFDPKEYKSRHQYNGFIITLLLFVMKAQLKTYLSRKT